MIQLPLCSSREVVGVLRRNGFEPGPTRKGSHQSYIRRTETRTIVVTVVLGKKEIPRGTLAAILKRAGKSREEFLKRLRGE